MKKIELEVIEAVEPYKLLSYQFKDGIVHLSSLFNKEHTMCGHKTDNETIINFDLHYKKINCNICKGHTRNLMHYPIYK